MHNRLEGWLPDLTYNGDRQLILLLIACYHLRWATRTSSHCPRSGCSLHLKGTVDLHRAVLFWKLLQLQLLLFFCPGPRDSSILSSVWWVTACVPLICLRWAVEALLSSTGPLLYCCGEKMEHGSLQLLMSSLQGGG